MIVYIYFFRDGSEFFRKVTIPIQNIDFIKLERFNVFHTENLLGNKSKKYEFRPFLHKITRRFMMKHSDTNENQLDLLKFNFPEIFLRGSKLNKKFL